MANTQGLSYDGFLKNLMLAKHAMGTTVTRGATTADTYKCALYLASATTGPSNGAYTATGEVSGTGYSAGGVTVAFTTPSVSTDVAVTTPSAAIVFSAVTLSSSFDCFMLYNSSQSNIAVGTFTFSAQTVNNADFTINMPSNAKGTALVQLGT